MKVFCFIVHGIGVDQTNFALGPRKKIDQELARLISTAAKKSDRWKSNPKPSKIVEYEELFWGDVSASTQEELNRPGFCGGSFV
jgi:hypothetical protein